MRFRVAPSPLGPKMISRIRRRRCRSGIVAEPRERSCACGRADCGLQSTHKHVQCPKGGDGTRGNGDVPNSWAKDILGEAASCESVVRLVARIRSSNAWFHVRHFSRTDFRIRKKSRCLKKDRRPTRAYRMSLDEVEGLDGWLSEQDVTPKKRRKSPKGVVPCVCGRDECNRDLGKEGGRVKAPATLEGRQEWAKIVWSGSVSKGNNVHRAAFLDNLGKTFWLDARHCNPDDLRGDGCLLDGCGPRYSRPQDVDSKGEGGKKAKRRRRALSTGPAEPVVPAPPPPQATAAALGSGVPVAPCTPPPRARGGMADRALRAKIRAVLLQIQVASSSTAAAHVEDAVAVLSDLLQPDTPAGDLGIPPSMEVDVETPGVAEWFIDLLRTKPDCCLYYTGEVCFAAVEDLLLFLDCDKAFSNMRLVVHVSDVDDGSAGQSRHICSHGGRVGAPPKLPLLHAWVLTLCVFRRFKSHIAHAARLFGVHRNTAERYYTTWVVAVDHLARYIMPVPTHEQLVAATSSKARALLGLKAEQGVVIGDATEPFVHDTPDRALHCAFYSQYKDHTTVKLLAKSDAASYLLPFEPLVPGACSDNKQHNVFAVAEGLPRKADGGTDLVYNFDRGLTDFTEFQRHGVQVHTSDVKARGQMAFDGERGKRGQSSAQSRIHIERNMKELREYAGFGDLIDLTQVDVRESECGFARFLCNLKPRLHNWTDRSAHTLPDTARKPEERDAAQPSVLAEDAAMIAALCG